MKKWGERKIEMHPTIPTLVELDEWLCARLRAKTLVSEPLPSLGKLREGDQGIDNRQEQLHRCSAIATGAMTGNQSLPTANTCLICNKKHKTEKCDKFMAMDVNHRAQLGKEKTLCFSRFESADHQSSDSSRKKLCDVEGYNKYHHPLIHGAAPVFIAPPPLNSSSPVSTLTLQHSSSS